MSKRIVFHCAAVISLLASMAFAQSAPKPATKPGNKSGAEVSARDAQSGMASGRKSGAIVAADFKSDNVQSSTTDAAHGALTGKRQHEPVLAADSATAGQNARNSAHATESLNAEQKPHAQSNPTYQDNGNQGTNPLFEKDSSAAKPSSTGTSSGANGKSKSVEYKDPEDQTTRYRPGNNKPSK
jgi:hypothetical protein